MTNSTYTAATHLLTTARQNGQLVKGCLPDLIGHLFTPTDMHVIAGAFDAICFDRQAQRFYDFEAKHNATNAMEAALKVIKQVLGMPVDTRTPIERMMGVQSHLIP